MKVAVTYAKDGLREIYSATDVYFVLRNFPDLRDKVFRLAPSDAHIDHHGDTWQRLS